jgi:hypothetical protein
LTCTGSTIKDLEAYISGFQAQLTVLKTDLHVNRQPPVGEIIHQFTGGLPDKWQKDIVSLPGYDNFDLPALVKAARECAQTEAKLVGLKKPDTSSGHLVRPNANMSAGVARKNAANLECLAETLINEPNRLPSAPKKRHGIETVHLSTSGRSADIPTSVHASNVTISATRHAYVPLLPPNAITVRTAFTCPSTTTP